MRNLILKSENFILKNEILLSAAIPIYLGIRFRDSLYDSTSERNTDFTKIQDGELDEREAYYDDAMTLDFDENGAWWPRTIIDTGSIISILHETETGADELDNRSTLIEYDEQLDISEDDSLLYYPEQWGMGILYCPTTVQYEGITFTTTADCSTDSYCCMACQELAVDLDPESIDGCRDKHIYCKACAEKFREGKSEDSGNNYCSICKITGRFHKEARLKNEFIQIKVKCPNECGTEGTIRMMLNEHLTYCSPLCPCALCGKTVDAAKFESHLSECIGGNDVPRAKITKIVLSAAQSLQKVATLEKELLFLKKRLKRDSSIDSTSDEDGLSGSSFAVKRIGSLHIVRLPERIRKVHTSGI